MKHICRAVLILEEECSIPAGRKPLMLETFLHRPLMERAAAQCLADGVQRFFVVCPPRFAAEAAACFPEGTAVTVSEQHAELLDFLDTDETTLVLCRAAVPYAEAGPGFAYAAPGREGSNDQRGIRRRAGAGLAAGIRAGDRPGAGDSAGGHGKELVIFI